MLDIIISGISVGRQNGSALHKLCYSEMKISSLEQADFGVNNGKKNYVPHPHSPSK